MAGRAHALFPHGGNQMSLAIAGGFGLGGAESYPGVFGDFGGFADDAELENGYLSLSERPGDRFRGAVGALFDHARARRLSTVVAWTAPRSEIRNRPMAPVASAGAPAGRVRPRNERLRV